MNTSLTDVERDDFPHDFKETKKKKSERGGSEKGNGSLSELADRELKDVGEKDDDEHEGTSPRV